MSGTLFLFIVANNITQAERQRYWAINNICSIITNIVFGFAFISIRFSNSSLEKPSFDYSNIPEKP
jgi:hypothetical protein